MAPFATSTSLALATECETIIRLGPPVAEATAGGLATCISLSSPGAADAVLARYPVALLIQEGQIGFAGIPLDRRVSSNPYLYLRFTDGKGGDLSDELFLGR